MRGVGSMTMPRESVPVEFVLMLYVRSFWRNGR